MAVCGCEVGKPARCEEGRALEEAETRAQVHRVRMMVRKASDPDRVAAVRRLQETRYALLQHQGALT